MIGLPFSTACIRDASPWPDSERCGSIRTLSIVRVVVLRPKRLFMKPSVNVVVPKAQLLQSAIEWAFRITQNSPDAVQSTKRALIETAKHGDIEQATVAHIQSPESTRTYQGENIKVSQTLKIRQCAIISRVVTLSGGAQSF